MKTWRKQVFGGGAALVLGMVMAFSSTVSAGASLEKEQKFTTISASEKDYEKSAGFEKELREDGIPYALEKITYETVSKTYLDKKQKTIKEVIYGEESLKPPEVLEEERTEYTFAYATELSTEIITDYDVYEQSITATEVASEKMIEVVDDETGETEEVKALFTGVSQEGSTTLANQMYITFYGYDADYYVWNGHEIEKNENAPALTGYENELLQTAGVSTANSRVTSIAWSGGTYYNADGVMCRDAIAAYQTTIPVYHANYEVVKTTYQYTYEAEDPEGNIQYEIVATAHYKQHGLSTLQTVFAGIGIVLLAALIVWIIMYSAKKKKEGQKNHE